MSRPSPTSRTLALLRAEGWTVDICERRLSGRQFVSVDLFHAFDLAAIRPDAPGVCGVQVTSASNHAAQVRKLADNAAVRTWIAAGNQAVVISWGCKAGWTARRRH